MASEKGDPPSSPRPHTIITPSSSPLPVPVTSEKGSKPFRVHWSKFKHIVSAATTASVSSESYYFEGGGGDLGKRAGSAIGWHRPANPNQPGHNCHVPHRWRRNTNPTISDEEEARDSAADGPVDEVIVNNIMPSPYDSDKASVTQPSSEHALNERSDTIHTDPTDPEPFPNADTTVAGDIWIFFRYYTWPLIVLFFNPTFHNHEEEQKYRKEAWEASKTLALVGSFFFILNWILGCAIHSKPFETVDEILYYGLGPALTAPLPLLIWFELPRRSRLWNWFYQFYLMSSAWVWAYHSLIYMFMCGFVSLPQDDDTRCEGKDFLLVLFYTNALPVMALFGLGQNRFFAMLGSIGCVVLMGVLIVPDRQSWVRHVVDTIIFQALLLYIHWAKEMAERNLFIFRERIKDQFKKTQKAQINEGRMAESKRRLTSYIFHEVRVPLNTAMLAVQNMEASGMIAKDNSDQDIEFQALEGSLSMMSKVLNDVLDFNRMDAGKFESVSRPYNFHTAIRSVIVPVRLAATTRGLDLEVILDPAIDQIARRAAYQALDQSEEWIRKKMEVVGEEDHEAEGLVTGDEMRLRQVITNLASNALKFTTHGKLTIVTKLVSPDPVTDPFLNGKFDKLNNGGSSLDRSMTRKSVDTAMGIIKEKNRSVSVTPHRRTSLDPKTPPQTPGFDPHGLFLGDRPSAELRRSTSPEAEADDSDGRRRSRSLEPRGSSEGTAVPPLFEQPLPLASAQAQAMPDSALPSTTLSAHRLRLHNNAQMGGAARMPKLENIVVRIEVIDTGVGIRASDMRDLKLFSPYVQTEIGRSQGGKGSGLGLALVRQIIQLSGGRLGVKSAGEPGKGSTFWVELNLGVGKKALSMASSSDSYDPSRASSLSRANGPVKPAAVRPSVSEMTRQLSSTTTSTTPGMEGRYVATVVPPVQSESALRTIMDQGGLVEMRPTRNSRVLSPDDYPVIAARAMSGDSTTVTSCTRLTDDEEVPGRTRMGRPTYVAMPPRPGFSALVPAPLGPTGSFSSATSQSPPTPTGGTVSSPPPVIHPPLQVLVVDDDPLTRRLFTRMLLRLGCIVHTAENGQIALDMLMGAGNKATPSSDATGSASIRSFYAPASAHTVARADQLHFDVVFLDNQMPVFSGLYVVAQLRAAGRKDLVVGVTGNALRADQDEYLEAGADHILTKPVLERNIRSMLNIAADRRLASEERDTPPSPLALPPPPDPTPPP